MPKTRSATKMRMSRGVGNTSELTRVVNEVFFTVKADEYAREFLSVTNCDLSLLEVANCDNAEFVFNINEEGKPNAKAPVLIERLYEWFLHEDIGNYFGIRAKGVKSVRIHVYKSGEVVNLPCSPDSLALSRRAIMVLKKPSTEEDFDSLVEKETAGGGGDSVVKRYQPREVFTFTSMIPMLPRFTKLVTDNFMIVSKNDLVKGYEVSTDSEKHADLSPPTFHRGRLTQKISKDFNNRMVLVCDFLLA